MKLLVILLLLCGCSHRACEQIFVNQVGYLPNGPKKAMIADSKSTAFSLVLLKNKQIVYRGRLQAPEVDHLTGFSVSVADFSNFGLSGRYCLQTEGGECSAPFEIKKGIYRPLLKSLFKSYYLHRAAVDLDAKYAGKWARPKTLFSRCTVWNRPSKVLNCLGGWLDAGDYGRYAVSTAVTVSYLLRSYQFAGSVFGDNQEIPESGNGINDILDEARVGIAFLFNLQREDGAVYHKATTKVFSPFGTVPWDKKYYSENPVYLFEPSYIATMEFCAVMAQVSQVFARTDFKLAKRALSASRKAWSWASKNHNEFVNPKGVSTGLYEYKSGHSLAKFWAAVELYIKTKEKYYFAQAYALLEDVYYGLSWGHPSALAFLALAAQKKIAPNFKNKMLLWSQGIQKSPWRVDFSQHTLFWGSNAYVASNAFASIIENSVKGNHKHLAAVQDYIDYILGRNPVGTSFVSGFGSKQVMHMHHRLSYWKKEMMPGLLVGGINQKLEDPAAKKYLKDLPVGRRYIDHRLGYSSNENAIDLNSYLIFVLSYLIANS